MKRLPTLALAVILILCVTRSAVNAQDVDTSNRVEELLSQMTLEEKVGQMTQLTLTAVATDGPHERGTVRLDEAKLREAIVDRHVGSILNVLDAALTLEGWHELVGEIQAMAIDETRLGIPIIYGVDAVHGHNYTRGGTIFPHNIGLAATFNRQVARRAGEVTADEVIASGTPWNFAPVLDVGRIPLWPRYYETFGEDPYVASELGREVIEGMQASGEVAATLKHYLGYSGSDVGRDRTPANLTERQVREYYLPPFRAAVEAGAKSVMVNSGEIDGRPVHASHYWLTDVLRGELGFDGVIVTDWEDVHFLHTRHRVAPTIRDAVQMAVEAGIDMSMTPYEYGFADHLIDLVNDGTIPESRIDESVRRILALKEDLGLFDRPQPDPSQRERFATPEAQASALQAARESITLLKNDGILPLAAGSRLLVTGPAANSLTALNGGWTYVWQGTDASQFPEGNPTIVEALRSHADVQFVEGTSFTEQIDLDATVAAAREADVAVIAIGEDAYSEWVGDIRDLTLPEPQLSLVEAIQATGTPTVLVLVEGRPRIINRIADDAGAIVMAYLPGMQGAVAIAEVLFGERNPSGKLPFTYPRHPNALDTYDHKYTQALGPGFDRAPTGFDPQFEFGHGLSYTTFSYSDIQLSGMTVDAREPVTASVTVTNSGDRQGRETVLLFTRQHYASLTPHVRRLRGFEKVDLAPGESQTVRFTLTSDDLGFIDQSGERVFEPGTFDVMIGDQTVTFDMTIVTR